MTSRINVHRVLALALACTLHQMMLEHVGRFVRPLQQLRDRGTVGHILKNTIYNLDVSSCRLLRDCQKADGATGAGKGRGRAGRHELMELAGYLLTLWRRNSSRTAMRD